MSEPGPRPAASANPLPAHHLEEPLADVEGGGEVLLFLNGGLMSWAAWEPIAALIREEGPDFRFLFCDLRGQLRSPGRAPADIADNDADIVALLDYVGLDRVHVLGASYGGEVGLALAGRHPERVRSLVAATVLDVSTDAMREGEERALDAVDAVLRGDAEPGHLHDIIVPDIYAPGYRAAHAAALAARRDLFARLPRAWYEDLRRILAASRRIDVRPHLAGIRCPVLVLLAANDAVMAPERTRALAAAIPGAQLKTHPTAGHALIVEDVGWVVGRCLEFWAGVGERRNAAYSTPLS